MKRSELMAWVALAGLSVIAVILLIGGSIYLFTGYWAGMMLAVGQAVVVGLAAWGLKLSREYRELSAPQLDAPVGMELNAGDTAHRPADSGKGGTLDIPFQRLMTCIAGVVLLILAATSGWLVSRDVSWANKHPDLPLPIVGTFALPNAMDELCLMIGLAAAGIYLWLTWYTRLRRDTEGEGEAVSSTFTLGMPGMLVLGAAAILGYLKVTYASEAAGVVIALLMALQGLELIVNAFRSYASVEELDQEAIDLHALPLVPMLGSVWLSGLRMLFTQSLGLSMKERSERGVIARMMPRAILAMIVIAIGLSCLRVVKPGTVAVLERFGYAPTDDKGQLLPQALLGEGLHLTLPWPMDVLQVINTEQLQRTDVGAPLISKWKNVDFQFWTLAEHQEGENEFLTGDAGAPQILETLVQIQWRVKDPAHFYSMLSHSDFYERGANETTALPIYQAIVKDCASYAVTRAFAIHSLDQIMIDDRIEVERHCREILQEKLDNLTNGAVKGSGIEVVTLVITDLHPPFWHADMGNPAETAIGPDREGNGRNKVSRGPASAFEFVVSMREWMEEQINYANAERVQAINLAQGDAQSTIANANAERFRTIAAAQAEAGRFQRMMQNLPANQKEFELSLLQQQMEYAALKEALGPVTKIIVDPRVKDIQIYQPSENNPMPRPPGQ